MAVRKLGVLMIFVCLPLIAACTPQGRGERAGERVDEIIDNVSEGEAPLKRKGTLEKTGESIDEALSGEDR